jgi:hypothetical protein
MGDKRIMSKDEMKNKYSAFITEISEIIGLGKPVDILKLCATTYLFFQPLEKQIEELEKESEEAKNLIEELASSLSVVGECDEEECELINKAQKFINKPIF